jgi:hypothetical protein
LSFGPKWLNTGNETYPELIVISTSWSIRWEIIVMVPTLGLTVSIYIAWQELGACVDCVVR